MLAFVNNTSAQDTKYVIVPIKIYKFNKVDIYGLSSLTNQLFAKAGYTVLTNNKMSWPEDLQNNECKAIYTDTEDISPLIGLTKVKLTLKNCYYKVLTEKIGKDNDVNDIKALHTALQEAFDMLRKDGEIEKAFASLTMESKQNPSNLPKQAVQKQPKAPETLQKKEEEVHKETKKSKITTLKNYWEQFGAKSIEGVYNKNEEQFYIKYDDGVFVLYNNAHTSMAKILPTEMPSIFKVEWKDGSTEVGYLKEEKTLILECHKEDTNTSFEFKKEFPNE